MQRAAVCERIAGKDSPRVPGRHAMTSTVDEKRRGRLTQECCSGRAEVRGNRVACRRAERKPADLRALAENRDGAPAEIDRVDVETAAFADSEARAVEELEQRGVSQRAEIIGVVSGDAVEQRDRVVATRDPRQLLRTASCVKSRRDIARDDTAVTEVTNVRVNRRGFAGDRRLSQPARLQISEVAAQRAMVELGRDLAATAFAPRDELVDIVRIRAARVLADARQRRREATGIVTSMPERFPIARAPVTNADRSSAFTANGTQAASARHSMKSRFNNSGDLAVVSGSPTNP